MPFPDLATFLALNPHNRPASILVFDPKGENPPQRLPHAVTVLLPFPPSGSDRNAVPVPQR
ncbi:hypothetical protein ROS9278_05041 [Roseomonas sp. CECT 9278]|nr:hypothetical protein ROS9278_05041 [Roseomonas sp. CECT 9278]